MKIKGQTDIRVDYVDKSNGIVRLLMNCGENRVNNEFLVELKKALDKVELMRPKTLVIASRGKFFSNGLDLNRMKGKSEQAFGQMVADFQCLLGRLLTFPCHTIAEVNGHAVGAGFFLALACDYRVMRVDQGWLNLPERNLGMNLSPGFAELAKCKLSPNALRTSVLESKRLAAPEAKDLGIVDIMAPLDRLTAKTKELAVSLLPPGILGVHPLVYAKNVSTIKRELYTAAYTELTKSRKAARL